MCDSNFLCLVFWISCAVGEVFFGYSVPRRCFVMFANHNPLENFVKLAVFSVLINLAGYERKVLLILCPQMMHHDLSMQI